MTDIPDTPSLHMNLGESGISLCKLLTLALNLSFITFELGKINEEHDFKIVYLCSYILENSSPYFGTSLHENVYNFIYSI